jgi:hypothetical protein
MINDKNAARIGFFLPNSFPTWSFRKNKIGKFIDMNFAGDYNGLRPSMILSSIKMIAITSNIWIKPPTAPSENPNTHRINSINTNVHIRSII